jgi:2-haloacid dehalogenase
MIQSTSDAASAVLFDLGGVLIDWNPRHLYCRMFADAPAMEEFLAGGAALYALTNWSAEKFPIARARFPFLEWFAGIVVSGEVLLKKPDPRIFDVAVRRFRLDPDATLFVDDARHNVAAAERLGFRTHHFTGAAGLRRALVGHGLLPG